MTLFQTAAKPLLGIGAVITLWAIAGAVIGGEPGYFFTGFVTGMYVVLVLYTKKLSDILEESFDDD